LYALIKGLHILESNMKPKSFALFAIAGVILFTSACREFIEPSIAEKQVQLNAPANQFETKNYTVNFWYDEVDDALQYHLQIVTPQFDSINNLVVDTVLKGNKFSMSLAPGTYEWRVRAENGSSKTGYSAPRAFNIVFSSIKQQKVQLFAPANNVLNSQSTVLFQWSNMYGATRYRLQIDTNSFIKPSSLVYDQIIPAQQLNFSLSKDQLYQWRVRAENDTAESQWSSINLFTYDHTPPQKVTLTQPVNNQNLSQPLTLQWNQSATAVKYRLYLYRSDGTTSYSTTFPLTLTTTSYNFNAGTSGDTIYWKVTAIDAAGNESAASDVRAFNIL
jgi:hypothetical protein